MCYYPKRIFLDDLFLFRVGSGGEKENGEKNRRAFALGKGFDADAFVFWLVFAVFRRENGKNGGICFVSEEEPRKGRVRRSGAVGVIE